MQCQSKLKTREGLKAHMQLFHGQLTTFSCNQCTYKSSTEPDLEKHKSVEHKESQFRNDKDRDVRSNSNSFEKKRFCNYWNYSSCDFGDNCKYLHEEIPSCRFQEKCNKENCYFFSRSQQKIQKTEPFPKMASISRSKRKPSVLNNPKHKTQNKVRRGGETL